MIYSIHPLSTYTYYLCHFCTFLYLFSESIKIILHWQYLYEYNIIDRRITDISHLPILYGTYCLYRWWWYSIYLTRFKGSTPSSMGRRRWRRKEGGRCDRSTPQASNLSSCRPKTLHFHSHLWDKGIFCILSVSSAKPFYAFLDASTL